MTAGLVITVDAVIAAAGYVAHQAGDDGHGLGVASTVALIAAAVALAGVLITNVVNMRTARVNRMGGIYADALGAVSDYLEAPYRVRRKDETAAHRNQISGDISAVQSRIDHSKALLRLNAPKAVADAFDEFVKVARQEAGAQISEAWDLPPVTDATQMHMSEAYPRERSIAARKGLVTVMQRDLERWFPARSQRKG